MLLPHGFEGQGPDEHSSARMERFLALREDNIQVVILPARRMFSLLETSSGSAWRKPLVVMTPKVFCVIPKRFRLSRRMREYIFKSYS